MPKITMRMVDKNKFMVENYTMDCYKDRIAEISKRLQEKSLGEVEAEIKTNKYNYIGVGFGYNLKETYPTTKDEAAQFTQTPEFDELVALSKAL